MPEGAHQARKPALWTVPSRYSGYAKDFPMPPYLTGPPAYAGNVCFDSPTSSRKGSAPVYAGTELLFLVADRGAAGRVSGGVPVISLVRFLL